jgi:glutathione S-transferase
VKAKLYVLLGAHPSRTAILMLEHKGIAYETVELPPISQPIAMRLLGFKADPSFSRLVDGGSPPLLRLADRLGTVPALRLGERRVMTNRKIARFLDELVPDPPLFPEDPERRQAVEEAERWGDEVLQMAARRLVVAGVVLGGELLNDGADGRLGPLLYRRKAMRRATAHVIARIAFRVNAETEATLLSELPQMLDRVDAWIADGVLDGEELNAADYMIAPSLAVLTYRPDLAKEIERRPAISLLDRLLPDPHSTRAGRNLMYTARPVDPSASRR